MFKEECHIERLLTERIKHFTVHVFKYGYLFLLKVLVFQIKQNRIYTKLVPFQFKFEIRFLMEFIVDC